MYRRLIISAAAVLFVLAASTQAATAGSPSSGPGAPEHPTRAPIHPNTLPTDQLKLVNGGTAKTAQTAQTTTAVAPFLTRPYWGWHAVNSIFDHCLSSGYYVADGKICQVDGTVALKSNGVDPGFSLGYAATPGGTNYVYYDGHNGWDFALNYETLIAAAPGVVTYAGWDSSGWGNTILIDHGNGFKTRYAHLSEVDVSLNQQVARGQKIGISGNTGNSTGAHLHFGVYRTDKTLANGDMVAVDPWGWQSTTATDPWPYDEGDLWLTGNPHDPVPDAPQNVAAASTCGSALVTWTPPAFDGGSGLTAYTIVASPGGANQVVDGNTTRALFQGLTPGTSYSFKVAAWGAAGQGPAAAAANSLVAPPSGPVDDTCHLYTVSGTGQLYANGLAPRLNSTASFGFNIVRGLAELPDGSGGYVLDGYGALHEFGSAVAVQPSAYWSGWDVARSVALAPWSTASSPQGWVLDAYGGIHPFGGAPDLTGGPSWKNFPIAKQLVVLPDSTPASAKAYVLDGYGGIHSVNGAPAVTDEAYWAGWNIARGITLLPASSATAAQGYTLDAFGGIHAFGGAPSLNGSVYWPNWDIARGITAWNAAPAGSPGGWVMDGWGGLHPFGSAAAVANGGYTPGVDSFRGMAGSGA